MAKHPPKPDAVKPDAKKGEGAKSAAEAGVKADMVKSHDAKSNAAKSNVANGDGATVGSVKSRRASPGGTSRVGARPRFGRVLVIADGEKDAVNPLVADLRPWLAERGSTLDVELDVRAVQKQRTAAGSKASAYDLVIVLGGDGAILAAVRAFAQSPVPTIGINFGRVGFLASVEAASWQSSLEDVFAGRATVEHRMRLVAELVTRAQKPDGTPGPMIALNDAVITRGAFQGMLSIALQDGGDWVTNYRADGLVVATPSGSTAYSMAAGGPILAPSLQAFVVTPVCPQALSHRPLVVDGDHELVLHVTRASGLTTLVVDGHGFYPMHEGDSVKIRRHPQPYPLLSLPGFDSYKRLRERLGWRGSVEPDVFPPAAPRLPEPESEHDTGGVL